MSQDPEETAHRAALLEAALTVFARKGYTSTGFEEVAVAAHLSRGVLYQHFKSKAELYVAALQERWTETTASLWPLLQGPDAPGERLQRFLVTWFTRLERDERLRTLLEVAFARAEHLHELEAGVNELRGSLERWVEALTAVFESLQGRGELAPGHAPRTAALAVLAFVQGVTTSHLLSPALFSPAADAERLAAVLLQGLLRSQAK